MGSSRVTLKGCIDLSTSADTWGVVVESIRSVTAGFDTNQCAPWQLVLPNRHVVCSTRVERADGVVEVGTVEMEDNKHTNSLLSGWSQVRILRGAPLPYAIRVFEHCREFSRPVGQPWI